MSRNALFDSALLQYTMPHYYTMFTPNSGVKKEKNMSYKFNIGDKVILTTGYVHIPEGSYGEIVSHFNSSNGVMFYDDIDNLHNCQGVLSTENGYFIETSYLALAEKPRIVNFDTVVIADEKRQQILEALEQVNQQDLIFKTWGFEKTIEKGKGVSMLFYGPPGTGKTLMAQAIADKLEYTLKIIAAADIESSEPGQAERNIRDHFKGSKGTKTILLFDECDSLIFDRTAVGAILGAQVNELLSSLEKFDGITIFTTNRIETLDEAVDRRLALKLEFSMPNQEERAEIWKRMIPKEAPLGKDINYMKLATVEMAGGHIKNSVLRAARIAATQKIEDAKKKITMEHLVKALTQEGKSMIAFKKAKENMQVARPVGPGTYMGADRHLQRTATKDMLTAFGGNTDA